MKIENLPKWAREKIADLERELIVAEGHIKDLEGRQPESNTFVETYRGLSKTQFTYLRSGATVTFSPSKDGYRDIDVRLTDHGILHIMGHGSIVVKPGSSNVIDVECEK